MNHKKQITKEQLEQLYVIERKSPREIGMLFQCSAATILNRLRQFEIPVRTISESLTGRQNTWAAKAAEKNRGKKRPGVGGRKKGCVGWSKGLTKADDPRLLNTGKQKEQHWRWKGGVSAEHTLIRQSGEYKRWHTLVFERDNFTCQHCSQRGGNLEAHHKSHFATDIENRFNLENGVTLCKQCHTTEHKKEKYHGSSL